MTFRAPLVRLDVDEIAASPRGGCCSPRGFCSGRAQTVAELPDDKFKLVVEKTALYTRALNAARVVQKSYDRYASWVDVKTGPTGREKTVEGVPEIASAGLSRQGQRSRREVRHSHRAHDHDSRAVRQM